MESAAYSWNVCLMNFEHAQRLDTNRICPLCVVNGAMPVAACNADAFP